MKTSQQLAISLRFALRELRGGVKGFRVFLACLVLGVGAIAAVGTLTDGIKTSLGTQGQSLLAGDIEVRISQQAANEEELSFFEAAGVVSQVLRTRAVIRAERTNKRTLIELKAVDEAYPLYGSLTLNPALTYSEVYGEQNGMKGLAVDPFLAERLNITLGDIVRLGDIRFELRALIEFEPDRSNEGFLWGPTVMIALNDIPATGLVTEGSLYGQLYKIKLPLDADVIVWREYLNASFPDANWRVRDRDGSAPGVRRFLDSMGQLLSLVSLVALLVGGVGVGNAVGNYMRGKTGVIATMKILGADSRIVFQTYLIQIMLFTLAAILVGLALGLVGAFIIMNLISDVLPVAVDFLPSFWPLGIAAFYGLCVSLIFSMWPLAVAKKVPPVRLLRDLVAHEKIRPALKYVFFILVLIVAIMALAIFTSPWRYLAAGFVVGAVAVILLLRWAGAGVVKLATLLPRPRKPTLRLALANLHRPGAATGAVVMSLGLGLSLFAMVVLVDRNFSQQLNQQIPDEAPAFFLLDIQKDQVDDFMATIEQLAGVTDLNTVPSLRGRITVLDGVPSEEAEVEPDDRWVISGDRTLTYSTTLPDQNTMVAGDWWPADYNGPPLVSFAAEEAAGLGLEVGDYITVNILGVEVTAEIASLRSFDWSTRGFNFVMVFDPNSIKAAPHTFMASLKVEDQYESEVHRAITDTYPNITAIRIKEILTSIDNILVQIRSAVNYTGALAILAGVLVLGGALAAGYRFRVYDSVILKILGAIRRDVLRAFVLEYIFLGTITGVLALVFGGVASYLVIVEVMDMEFTFFPTAAIATVLASLVITLVFGILNTWQALGAKPTKVLREL